MPARIREPNHPALGRVRLHHAPDAVPRQFVDQAVSAALRVDQAFVLHRAEGGDHGGHARAGGPLHVGHAQPAAGTQPLLQCSRLHDLLRHASWWGCGLAQRGLENHRQQRRAHGRQLPLDFPVFQRGEVNPAGEVWMHVRPESGYFLLHALAGEPGFLQHAESQGARRLGVKHVGQRQQHTSQLDRCAGALYLQENVAISAFQSKVESEVAFALLFALLERCHKLRL